MDRCDEVCVTICRTSVRVQLWLIHFILVGTEPWQMAYTTWNHKNILCVAIKARATPRHFHIWLTTVGQLRHADYRGAFVLKYAFYRWTRQSIHNTLIIVNRYLRLMGDKTILDEASSGIVLSPIHLPHQGVVDSYGPCWPMKQNSVCHLSVCHW